MKRKRSIDLEGIKNNIECQKDELKKEWGESVGLRKPKHAWR